MAKGSAGSAADGSNWPVAADTPVQRGLFDDSEKQAHKWDKVEAALDAITRQFGKDIIARASLREK